MGRDRRYYGADTLTHTQRCARDHGPFVMALSQSRSVRIRYLDTLLLFPVVAHASDKAHHREGSGVGNIQHQLLCVSVAAFSDCSMATILNTGLYLFG